MLTRSPVARVQYRLYTQQHRSGGLGWAWGHPAHLLAYGTALALLQNNSNQVAARWDDVVKTRWWIMEYGSRDWAASMAVDTYMGIQQLTDDPCDISRP